MFLGGQFGLPEFKHGSVFLLSSYHSRPFVKTHTKKAHHVIQRVWTPEHLCKLSERPLQSNSVICIIL